MYTRLNMAGLIALHATKKTTTTKIFKKKNNFFVSAKFRINSKFWGKKLKWDMKPFKTG